MKNDFPERWINAFLTGVKVQEICKAAGISRTKYYRLRSDPEFQKELRIRKDRMIEAAVSALQEHFLKDVNILQEIADNPEIAPQVRINAVSVSLQQLREWVSITDILQRLTALETEKDENDTIWRVS